MCRLAYIPRPFRGVARWLDELEFSNGGHGSGVAVGGALVKGARLSARATYREYDLLVQAARKGKKRVLPALWHTRYVSSGKRCDDLCHPFECDGGWLVHNGHWGHMHAQALAFGGDVPMSDTRLFSMIVDHVGFEEAVLENRPPGVWVHMRYDGERAVWKSGGSLHFNHHGVIGSEPADDGRQWRAVKDGFCGYGEPLAAAPAPKVVNLSSMEFARIFRGGEKQCAGSTTSRGGFRPTLTWTGR